MAKEIKISLLGHKDHGKSTLIGRLLYETHSITEDRINEAKATCKALGKEFEYAFLLDSFEEEREGGFTLDTTRAQVHHNNVIYELIDVPGHKELVKNMLTGASLAHAAILIVSAQPNERLRDETKLHLYLASLLGIKNLVVAINKIDTIHYNEEEFSKIKKEITEILESFDYDELSFVPVSAMKGDNIVSQSDAVPWYKGKTIIEFMEEFANFDYEKEIRELPARMFVQDVYDGMLVGRIETGVFRIGEEIAIEPVNTTAVIQEMIVRHKNVEEAHAGQNVGMKLIGNGTAKRGDVCMPAKSKVDAVKTINAKIFCLPGNEMKVGDKLSIICASQEGKSKIVSIEEKINPITDKEPKKDVNEISGWEAAKVRIELSEPLVFESFSKIPHTGRFVLLKDGVMGVGVVL
ncbi:50S ribosome-binding GTPase [Candidatus Micrarchaeota archaeon]|nr:50S ribosome-binding GTPase [Candidatus Micrarchaeota archaeon]